MNDQIQHEKIRLLAYTFYLERGRHEGSPFEDWLRAEKEVAEVAGETKVSSPANGMYEKAERSSSGHQSSKGSTAKLRTVFPEVQKRTSESQPANSNVKKKY